MRRHELDVVSLVFGLMFGLVVVAWPLWRSDIFNWGQLSWLPALALIGIGLLGVTLSIARSRSNATEPAQVGHRSDDDWTLD